MELSDTQLQEFRDRCLKASVHGHTIALADLYVASLAQEVGQEVVPDGTVKGSPEHLLALADEALAARAGGSKKKVRKEKVVMAPPPPVETKKPEPKVEAKVEKPEPKVEKPEAKIESKDVGTPADKPKEDSSEKDEKRHSKR